MNPLPPEYPWSDPPPWLKRAVRWRYAIFAIYVLAIFSWYYIFFSSSEPLSFSIRDGGWTSLCVSALILFGAPALLLAGAPHWCWPKARRKKSMAVSLITGAAIATVLSAGIIFAVVEWWNLPDAPESPALYFSPTTTPVATQPAITYVSNTQPATAMFRGSNVEPSVNWEAVVDIGALVVGWIFWLFIFAWMGVGQWMHRFGRMYRILVAGTVLEMLITIPIDVEVRKRVSCYCGGSMIALMIGITSIIWIFGPGVVILFLIRRAQRLDPTPRCKNCGYDLQGLTSNRCPECGTPFAFVTQTGLRPIKP